MESSRVSRKSISKVQYYVAVDSRRVLVGIVYLHTLKQNFLAIPYKFEFRLPVGEARLVPNKGDIAGGCIVVHSEHEDKDRQNR